MTIDQMIFSLRENAGLYQSSGKPSTASTPKRSNNTAQREWKKRSMALGASGATFEGNGGSDVFDVDSFTSKIARGY